MNMAFKRGLSSRLMLITVMIALALLASAIFTNRQLQQILDLSHQTSHNRIPQLTEIAEVQLNVTRASLQLRQAMLARNHAERQAAVDDVQALKDNIDALLKRHESKLFTAEGRRRFEPIKPAMTQFWFKAGETLRLIQVGQPDAAFAHLMDQTVPARNVLLKHLSDTVSHQRENSLEDLTNIEASVLWAKWSLTGVFLVLSVGLIAFSYWLSLSLDKRIQASREVIEQVRDGNLNVAVQDTAQDEFTPLLKALQEMQSGLYQVVQDVRARADLVATASLQIAQGSSDLSERTERQAGALQQTASTMEQLATTVQHNTVHAQQAASMAQDASRVAQEGGGAVSQLVDTMLGIHEASRKIVEITVVIDAIAFQTNILALNAAVEAARAGEHGRGFAVVASEVRLLAQRSADAARQIKSLITVSGEQVEQGAALAQTAGQTMAKIVKAIEHVNGIVQDISLATTEQQKGVQLMGTAMAEMDQSTQQNAALVLESASAAQSLQSQSGALVESVAAFKLA